jgi:hypothetical protein
MWYRKNVDSVVCKKADRFDTVAQVGIGRKAHRYRTKSPFVSVQFIAIVFVLQQDGKEADWVCIGGNNNRDICFVLFWCFCLLLITDIYTCKHFCLIATMCNRYKKVWHYMFFCLHMIRNNI